MLEFEAEEWIFPLPPKLADRGPVELKWFLTAAAAVGFDPGGVEFECPDVHEGGPLFRGDLLASVIKIYSQWIIKRLTKYFMLTLR